jgi:tryptophan 2,3-dioxygenase
VTNRKKDIEFHRPIEAYALRAVNASRRVIALLIYTSICVAFWGRIENTRLGVNNMTESKISAKVPDKNDLTYTSYLKVHELLGLQELQSAEHDETLFIIIHQAYELWFKQLLHEFGGVVKFLQKDQSMPIIKALKRILRIQDTLNGQIVILETMTPNDFNYFRSKLNPASGFQSHQFRLLEFRLGLKDERYLKYHHHPETARLLDEAMNAASIYDQFLQYANRRGLKIPSELLKRNVKEAHTLNVDLAKEFAKVYQSPEKYPDLYEILELLLDYDQKLGLWRYRHVQMVERIIGITMGTGGTMGVEYLAATIKKRAFPEIWASRQYIIQDLSKMHQGKT